ncbi:EamA family transporter [Candidatus Woesearchaeota archaeon]|nr:EamA family transporter [Candidatus Woesearchaeota archaeon]
MLWLLFAFLSAFFDSLKDTFSKKSMQNVNEYISAWSLRVFSSLFLLPFIFFTKIPSLNKTFFLTLFASSFLNLGASIFYMKGLKYSDLSITTPMLTFSPLLLLMTSYLFLGEVPKLLGIAGVVLIFIGSYALNLKETSNGFLGPFKALLKEKGPRYMLCVAVIWSIAANFDKIGVLSSSPLVWSFSVNFFSTLAFFPIVFFHSKKNLKTFKDNIARLAPIGFSLALAVLFQMYAFQIALVAYVISVKRLSVVMGVLWGYLIFKEKNIKQRLVGVLIMLVGVILIALS